MDEPYTVSIKLSITFITFTKLLILGSMETWMNKTDIVPAPQGFIEDWRRQTSKRQLHTMKCGRSFDGGHAVAAGGLAGHLAQIWETRKIFLEAAISKLRHEKWLIMNKRRSLQGRVFLQKQQLKKFWGWGRKHVPLRSQGAEECLPEVVLKKWVKVVIIISWIILTPPPFIIQLLCKNATTIIYQWKENWLENQVTWFLLLAPLWKTCVTLMSLRSFSGPLSFAPWKLGPGRIVSQYDILWLHLLSLRNGHWVAFGPVFFPSIVSVSNVQWRLPILRTLSRS